MPRRMDPSVKKSPCLRQLWAARFGFWILFYFIWSTCFPLTVQVRFNNRECKEKLVSYCQQTIFVNCGFFFFFFFHKKKSERFVIYFYTQQMLRAKPSHCPRHFSKIPVLTPRASVQPSRTEYISGICFLKTLDARSPFNTGKQTEVSLLPAALQVYNGLCLCGGSRVSDVCIAIRRLERTCNCEKTLEYTVNRSAVWLSLNYKVIPQEYWFFCYYN